MGIEEHIPRMFHRRLLLLGAALVVMVLPLATQMFRLTVVDGAELRRAAQRRLITDRFVGNVRGRIVDRRGKLLAVDVPSYDIAVPYACISGAWAETYAVRLARQRNREIWSELSAAERADLADEVLPIFSDRLDVMWGTLADAAGVPAEQLILQRDEIQQTIERLASRVRDRQRQQQADRLAREREISFDEALEQVGAGVAREIREEVAAHVVLAGVSDETAFRLIRAVTDAIDPREDLAMGDPLSGVEIVRSGIREYPFETMQTVVPRDTLPSPLAADTPAVIEIAGVATHIVGWMRDRHFEEDADRRAIEHAARTGDRYDKDDDRGRYLPTDRVGHTGMERGEEYALRGQRGRERKHLDTGEIEIDPTEDGRDVHLTIDIELQARIAALYDPSIGLAVVQPWAAQKPADGVPAIGDPLAGAVVVIDIDSSDILAMVSAPSFTRIDGRENSAALRSDLRSRRMLNRTTDMAFAPGSIVKPLMLCAAVTDDVYRPDEQITCTGHFLPDRPNILRCWIKKQFEITHNEQLGHDLDGSDAIMGSCNIFFYEIGRRLGPKRLTTWYRRFGVAPLDEHELSPTDLGLGPQRFDGALGRLVDGRRRKPTADEAVLMAIGQGPIAWTPLHAAACYAAIGRGGVYMTPRLRLDDDIQVIDLGLDPAGIDQALHGLQRSVLESTGTTHHVNVPDGQGGTFRQPLFNVPGVEVWAKSGTAEASKLVDEQKQTVLDGDHSWCVLLAGPTGGRPRVVIAVVTEYGGSGGKVSGPIANQALRAVVETGHLEPAPETPDPFPSDG